MNEEAIVLPCDLILLAGGGCRGRGHGLHGVDGDAAAVAAAAVAAAAPARGHPQAAGAIAVGVLAAAAAAALVVGVVHGVGADGVVGRGDPVQQLN